ncbi:hypothetical protein E1I69_23245 [Bacillus timonensis]|uniref:Uncharacterized protein n=1 Tax=Bacillus timonensis TaxID=1033734 RepID=A0A4S3PJV2_9BACI|nr:hypothetical protein [Bacillus timonensis]THE09235.1 hypothetical protein E1I69_23245 [Bacillus timonensis]
MLKSVLLPIFIFQLLSTSVVAQTQDIQIFDIDQDMVIKHVPIRTDIQQEVEFLLKGINGVYVKYNPIPKKGLMIRIPLEPTIMVRNKWFHDLADEVTLIFTDQESPYLMMFDDENKPYFLTFKGDTIKLLTLLNLNQSLF